MRDADRLLAALKGLLLHQGKPMTEDYLSAESYALALDAWKEAVAAVEADKQEAMR
jgi:hypothetical protein